MYGLVVGIKRIYSNTQHGIHKIKNLEKMRLHISKTSFFFLIIFFIIAHADTLTDLYKPFWRQYNFHKNCHPYYQEYMTI